MKNEKRENLDLLMEYDKILREPRPGEPASAVGSNDIRVSFIDCRTGKEVPLGEIQSWSATVDYSRGNDDTVVTTLPASSGTVTFSLGGNISAEWMSKLFSEDHTK